MNAADKKQSDADKKRKRLVKKRRGKKLTVVESERAHASAGALDRASERSKAFRSSTTRESMTRSPPAGIFSTSAADL
eukprot:jgi/Tetstr1/438686/TSEL_027236.t1